MSRAFTLLELLVVIAVVSILAAMALSLNREDRKEVQVKAAAQELASVLRETRERAIKTRQMYAVVFHIENEGGSSGRVLNNRSGGHWYRVMGPTPGSQGWTFQIGMPPFFQRDYSGMGGSGRGTRAGWNIPGRFADNPIRHFLESVNKAWISDVHRLPRRQVRFLALNDQDNGDFATTRGTYAPTYPRPWFGTWDETAGRIFPWGGYDPELPMTNQTGKDSNRYRARSKGGRILSHSGFFYEGYDGPITGCRHPSDRLVIDDTNGDGSIILDPSHPAISDDPSLRYSLWRAGDPRPLIDANWQDMMLIFRPDGKVVSSWMRMRHLYAFRYHRGDYLFYDPTLDTGNTDATPATGRFHLRDLAPFDRCNRIYDSGSPSFANNLDDYPEASSFHARSGFHFITLAPDSLSDQDTYPNIDSYLQDLAPCYRVGISTQGEVKIIRVRTRARPGRMLDSTITDSDWNNRTTTSAYYQKGMLTDVDGSPRGEPITDTVSAEMLLRRVWWWK